MRLAIAPTAPYAPEVTATPDAGQEPLDTLTEMDAESLTRVFGEANVRVVECYLDAVRQRVSCAQKLVTL